MYPPPRYINEGNQNLSFDVNWAGSKPECDFKHNSPGEKGNAVIVPFWSVAKNIFPRWWEEMLSGMRGGRKIRNRETKRKPWKHIVKDSIRRKRKRKGFFWYHFSLLLLNIRFSNASHIQFNIYRHLQVNLQLAGVFKTSIKHCVSVVHNTKSASVPYICYCSFLHPEKRKPIEVHHPDGHINSLNAPSGTRGDDTSRGASLLCRSLFKCDM